MHKEYVSYLLHFPVFTVKFEIICLFIGAWRSLVAYSLGVRVVGRSNRLAPTIFNKARNPSGPFLFA